MLGAVALFLKVDKLLEGEVETVGEGPYGVTVLDILLVVFPVGSERQGNLVLIIVVFDIGAEAQEYRQLSAAQVGYIVDKAFGMHPHLEPLIVAEVVLGVAVNSARVARLQTEHLERHRLLVELEYLRLSGVGGTCHTRGEDIVDRLASGVLLDIDHRYVEFALGRRITAGIERIAVGSPLAAHQLEGGKAQMGH